jgi:hypothetical protein
VAIAWREPPLLIAPVVCPFLSFVKNCISPEIDPD